MKMPECVAVNLYTNVAAGTDHPHRDVRRDLARVEVDRVSHRRAVVDECDLERVTDLPAQDRSRHLTVVGPHQLRHARRDLDLLLVDVEGHLVHRAPPAACSASARSDHAP